MNATSAYVNSWWYNPAHMSRPTLAQLAPLPPDRSALLRLGDGDPDRTKKLLIAMYAYLADKPPNTQRSYRTSLRQFFELTDWMPPEKISVAEAASFKRLLMKQGKSPSTICVRLAGVDGFFEYLLQPTDATSAPLISSNPFSRISRKDVLPTPFGRTIPVEPEDFKKMLEAMPADVVGLRDKCILIFLAYTGRRRQEVARLRVRDLDLKARPRTYKCIVKGNRETTFELPDICYDAIRAHWISADRLKHLKPDSGVFGPVGDFVMTSHLDPQRPLSADQIWRIVKRAAQRADVDETRVRVHGFRHMAARDLDRAGVPLQDIARFLDHANMSTTQRYLGKLRGPAPSLEQQLVAIRGHAKAAAVAAVE